MRKLVFIFFFLLAGLNLFAQTTEHYLQIAIDDRADLNYLTLLVSIDKVTDLEVIAYANDDEFEVLKTTKFKFIELEHPSIQASRSIIMATTVGEMVNWDRYPTYSVYNQLMVSFVTKYPNLCKLNTVGTSVRGRNILALNITSSIALEKAKPEVLLSSTMHGDETTGWILCMRLADYLMSNYGTNPRITRMLDSVSIFIAPNTNPDGTYYGGDNTISNARRANYNGYDLNRNFPDPWQGATPGGPRQQETTVMMDYAATRNFILSINYHGGAEVANYPWDGYTSAQRKHPDNNWYIELCRQYATLAKNYGPLNYFTNPSQSGITNGGDWYVVYGGRQDYMNYWHNCKEITAEISNTKMLPVEQLENFWNYNREAMLAFIENVYYGIRGKVTDSGGNPLAADITLVGYDQHNSFVKTNPKYGNYYRMLLPGTYTLRFESAGYITQTIPNVVVGSSTATYLNVVMQSIQTNTYNITAAVNGGNGTITPSGIVKVNHGGSQSFSITPKAGYRISQVLVNGVNNPAAVASSSYTFTNVTANQTITVFFAAIYINPSLTGIKINGNSIAVADNMSYMTACGEENLTLTLDSEGTITVNGTPYSIGMTVSFINDKAVINIESTGTDVKTYTLNASKALGSAGMPMYVQRWGKTLAVINNPANNGGHTFNMYRWYINNSTLHESTAGYILLNGREAAEYAAEVYSTKTGEWHKLCHYVKSSPQTALTVYPNPVEAGQLLTINLPEEVNTVNVNIYDLSGNLVSRQSTVHCAVSMPGQAGMYIIEIQLPDGSKETLQVIVK